MPTVKIIMAVTDAIRELKQVPSGHLYARLMGHMSLDSYQKVIDILKVTGMVKEDRFHMLTWVEPEK